VKLVTYRAASGDSTIGFVVDDRVYHLGQAAAARHLDLPDTMVALLEAGPEAMASATEIARQPPEAADSIPLASVTLLAPIPRPPKLLALAGNYMKHVVEGRGAEFEKRNSNPRPFMIPSSSVIGSGEDILIPSKVSNAVDYEMELAVVIGASAREVSVDDAPNVIAGYTVFNDVSARRLLIAENREQRQGDKFFDWLLGKWPDTFAPMGPHLVTADEVGDPQRLAMKLRVNGELRQDACTDQMIWNCYEVVAFISEYVTLEPGDVIATGTAAGVGGPKGIFLQAGDLVEAEIEGLGRLVNRVAERL